MSATPQPGGAEFVLVMAGFAFVPMMWIATARYLRRQSTPVLGAHVVGFMVGVVGWFIMMGFGIAGHLPIPMAILGLAVAGFGLRKTSAGKLPSAVPAGVQPDVAQVPPPLSDTQAQPLPHGEQLAGPPPAKTHPAPDLMHLVKGMMADGVFVQEEADYLFRWLGENRDRLDQYPYNAIYLRLDNALADGVLDEDEAADLGEFFRRLVDEPGTVDVVALRAAVPEARTVTEPPEASPVSTALPQPPRSRPRRASRAVIDHVVIRYRDSLGIETEREVNVHVIADGCLKGYCHLRGSIRSFRVDRIVGDVVRVDTGEVLPAKEWLDEVAA